MTKALHSKRIGGMKWRTTMRPFPPPVLSPHPFNLLLLLHPTVFLPRFTVSELDFQSGTSFEGKGGRQLKGRPTTPKRRSTIQSQNGIRWSHGALSILRLNSDASS